MCHLIKLYQGNDCRDMVMKLPIFGEGQGGLSTKVCRRTHRCGLQRSINDRLIGDSTLKDLYPKLYVCSVVKDACISEVLWIPEGGTVRVWDLRFYKAFEDWELVASYSLLQLI